MKQENKPFNKTEYDNKYKREHYFRIKIPVNKETENDIIEHYKKRPNKMQYIKNLIKEDMKEVNNHEQ